MDIIYEIITPQELEIYGESICDLLLNEWNSKEEFMKSLSNSAFIAIALDGGKVVGSFQMITDMHFVSFLISLWVDTEYRNK